MARGEINWALALVLQATMLLGVMNVTLVRARYFDRTAQGPLEGMDGEVAALDPDALLYNMNQVCSRVPWT